MRSFKRPSMCHKLVVAIRSPPASPAPTVQFRRRVQGRTARIWHILSGRNEPCIVRPSAPKNIRGFWFRVDASAKLADILTLGQTAQGAVVLQLLIFFFGQAYSDTHFFFFHLDHLLRKIGVFRGVPPSEVRRP